MAHPDQHARMSEFFDTRRYNPELPEGAVVDEHGLPVVADDPDEDPDETM